MMTSAKSHCSPPTKPTATPSAKNSTAASSPKSSASDDTAVDQLAILRHQWCREPTVTGTKPTGPDA